MPTKFIQKIIKYLSERRKKASLRTNWNRALSPNLNIEQRFTAIHKSNLWGSNETVSGPGSTLAQTRNLREKIPKLIQSYKIKSVFDAPCGDLNWMKYLFPKLRNVKYIGADIVKDLIEEHKKHFENKSTKFVHMNLIEEAFPKVDLMICRDCLFHLSYDDIKSVLENFIDAEIKYLLTTTFTLNRLNRNIVTGDFRRINLFKEPFYFDKKTLYRINDFVYPQPKRQICLWNRSQVIVALEKIKKLENKQQDT